MDEDIAIINRNTRISKIKNFFKKNLKKIITTIILILIILLSYFFYDELNLAKYDVIQPIDCSLISPILEKSILFELHFRKIFFENY